jgi:hypothetical protein
MKLNKAMFVGLCCVSSVAVLPHALLAQASKSQLDRCYALAGVNERVACYDNLARPSQDATATIPQRKPVPVVESAAIPGEAATVAKPAAPARVEPEASRMEKFGKQDAKLVADDKGEDTLIVKVIAVKELPANKLQITLANGQVWTQTIGKAFLLNPNDVVHITRSNWGNSFRLEKDGKPGFIQVARLQ